MCKWVDLGDAIDGRQAAQLVQMRLTFHALRLY